MDAATATATGPVAGVVAPVGVVPPPVKFRKLFRALGKGSYLRVGKGWNFSKQAEGFPFLTLVLVGACLVEWSGVE